MKRRWRSTGSDSSSITELVAGWVTGCQFWQGGKPVLATLQKQNAATRSAAGSPLLPAASARKVGRHGPACKALCRTWSITMKLTARVWFLLLTGLLSPAVSATAAEDLPEMKFNEVKEVAPGVFFRYSAISPKDVG